MNCALGLMYKHFIGDVNAPEFAAIVNHFSLRTRSNDLVYKALNITSTSELYKYRYEYKKILDAINNLTEVNDSHNSYYRRAKACRNHIVSKIVPLLPE